MTIMIIRSENGSVRDGPRTYFLLSYRVNLPELCCGERESESRVVGKRFIRSGRALAGTIRYFISDISLREYLFFVRRFRRGFTAADYLRTRLYYCYYTGSDVLRSDAIKRALTAAKK